MWIFYGLCIMCLAIAWLDAGKLSDNLKNFQRSASSKLVSLRHKHPDLQQSVYEALNDVSELYKNGAAAVKRSKELKALAQQEKAQVARLRTENIQLKKERDNLKEEESLSLEQSSRSKEVLNMLTQEKATLQQALVQSEKEKSLQAERLKTLEDVLSKTASGLSSQGHVASEDGRVEQQN